MRQTITTIGIAALLGTGCATMGYAVRQQQEQMSTEQVIETLESMTAAGQASTIAAYVNHYFQDHPDACMNEKYALGETLVQQMPNAIYTIAIDQNAEDVHEYFDSRIYVMEHMRKHGGFSFNYDLEHDE